MYSYPIKLHLELISNEKLSVPDQEDLKELIEDAVSEMAGNWEEYLGDAGHYASISGPVVKIGRPT